MSNLPLSGDKKGGILHYIGATNDDCKLLRLLDNGG